MFKMVARGKRAEISIYGEIDAHFGIGASLFYKDLKALGNVTEIDLRLNSPGGSVFEGLAIYNILRSHKAKVTAYVDGVAASIASVILLAADHRSIASSGFVMIHNPIAGAFGDSESMRKTADVMDSVKDTILDIYVSRTGLDRKAVSAMMDDETWMNAKDSKANGFAHSIFEGEQIAACASASALSSFRNTPESLRAASGVNPRRAFSAKAPNRSFR